MRSGVIVLFEPAVDDDLGLPCRREPFGVQDFPAQRAIEAFVVSILPGRSRKDVDWFDVDALQPFPERCSDKLRPIV